MREGRKGILLKSEVRTLFLSNSYFDGLEFLVLLSICYGRV